MNKFSKYDDFYHGVPAVEIFKPEARVSCGKCQFGEVPVGDFNLSDFLGTILIHFHLINATNEYYSLSKIYSKNDKL